MNIVIVDDEQTAVENLSMMLEEFCEGVSIVGKAFSVSQAIREINSHKPELVFLDIEMPHGNAFDILQCLPKKDFQTVFITAYDHYGVKAIKHNAIDYLLKPIDIDELICAVEKARTMVDASGTFNGKPSVHISNSLVPLPVNEGYIYVHAADITRVQADGSYCTFYLSDGGKQMVSKNLKDFEDLLAAHFLFRCHHSHIINLKRVKKFVRNDGQYVVMEDGTKVEISRRRKDDFLYAMGQVSAD